MIDTNRLRLRDWRDQDRAPFHAINSDPVVMATLGPLLSRADSDALIDRVAARGAVHGHTFWAVERRDDGALLGWCGLLPGGEGTPIEGEIEIGWRLGSEYWGVGYAREAAQASIDWAWSALDVPGVAAITSVGNTRSWGLMERLGMTRFPAEDFDHPRVPDGSPLKRHIVYRVARP